MGLRIRDLTMSALAMALAVTSARAEVPQFDTWRVTIKEPSCTVSKEAWPGVVISYVWPGHGKRADLFVSGIEGPITWNTLRGQRLVLKIVGPSGQTDADTAQTDLDQSVEVNGHYVTMGEDFYNAIGQCEDLPFVDLGS